MWQYNNELYHHGIMGQKWGVRRFQNKDGTLTPAGKKRYNLDADGNLVEKTKAEKKAYKNQVRVEKKREKLLDKMDPEEIYKNKKLFTTSELRSMSERMAVEKSIADLYDPGKEFVKSMNTVAGSMEAANKIAKEGTELYNKAAKIINSVSDKEVPVIGEKKKSKLEIETAKLEKQNAYERAKKENETHKIDAEKRKLDEKYNINELKAYENSLKTSNNITREEMNAEKLRKLINENNTNNTNNESNTNTESNRPSASGIDKTPKPKSVNMNGNTSEDVKKKKTTDSSKNEPKKDTDKVSGDLSSAVKAISDFKPKINTAGTSKEKQSVSSDTYKAEVDYLKSLKSVMDKPVSEYTGTFNQAGTAGEKQKIKSNTYKKERDYLAKLGEQKLSSYDWKSASGKSAADNEEEFFKFIMSQKK